MTSVRLSPVPSLVIDDALEVALHTILATDFMRARQGAAAESVEARQVSGVSMPESSRTVPLHAERGHVTASAPFSRTAGVNSRSHDARSTVHVVCAPCDRL